MTTSLATTQQISTTTKDACVDFPIFDAKTRSLKRTAMGLVGGNMGSDSNLPAIWLERGQVKVHGDLDDVRSAYEGRDAHCLTAG